MDNEALPENWQELDSVRVFYEYVALVREAWLAGELAELPMLFQPLPRAEE